MARSLKTVNYDGKRRTGNRRTNTLGKVRHSPGKTNNKKTPNQTNRKRAVGAKSREGAPFIGKMEAVTGKARERDPEAWS